MTNTSARWEALEREFEALGPQLPAGPTRQALSVLHALLLEQRRAALDGSPAGAAGEREDIANLHQQAPPMQGHAENAGLPVGTRAPDFTLPNAAGQPVSLADYRGQNVLLVFYPLDWSPACSDQLSLYQLELDTFERAGTQVIGISVDSLYSHGAWAAVRGLTFPLLADFNPRGQAAQRYHVWRAADGFSERALYLVDGAGTIRYAHVAPELHRVPDIYTLLEAIQALAA